MTKLVAPIFLASLCHGYKRYIQALAVAVACLASSEAGAQICCPAGCVQNNNGCVTTGANPRSCSTVPCNPGSGSSGGGSPGKGSGQAPANPVQPQCFTVQSTPAKVIDATNKCVASLVASAQLVGCFFEDDAGRAEDKRTGLTCAARQAALAKQCRIRCESFAQSISERVCTNDDFMDLMWHATFGDIGGNVVGSARVQACGPPLKAKLVLSPFSKSLKNKDASPFHK